MWLFDLRKREIYCRPESLLQQLEERIVLDAAVSPVSKDNVSPQPDASKDVIATAEAKTVTAPDSTSLATPGQLLPTKFDHVFNENLNVVLVSNALADVESVSHAAISDAKVIVYDAQKDNLSTITAQLQNLEISEGKQISTLALVSHADKDALQIGNDNITLFTLGNYRDGFQSLGSLLSNDSQIQFYGCDLAGNFYGQAMMQTVASWTHASVFASTDSTGGSTGDWNLEYSAGTQNGFRSLFVPGELSTSETLGASILMDLNTGSTIEGFGTALAVGDNTFLTVNMDGDVELWMYNASNGWKWINTNPNGGDFPYKLTAVGTNLFVQANDSNWFADLWMVDSSGNKTKIDTSPGSDSPDLFTAVGSKLFVVANDVDGNRDLWMVDSSGTKTQINTNPNGSDNPDHLTAVGTNLFVSAADINGNQELWMVDSSGTKTLINTNTNGADNPDSLTAAGTNLFLKASDSNGNQDLWIVDQSGTKIQINTNPNGSDNPDLLTAVGSNLFAKASDGSGNQDLWMVNSSGTKTLINTNPNGSDNPNLLTAVGTNLFVKAADGTGNQELWMVDSSGTKTDINTNLSGSDNPSKFTAVGSNLYLSAAYDSTGNQDLWMVNSTGTKTRIDTDPNGADDPDLLTPVGTKLFLKAYGSTWNRDLWMVDSSGTKTDINTMPNGSDYPYLFTQVGTKLFVNSNDAIGFPAAWSIDQSGIASQITLNQDPSASSDPSFLTAVGNVLFFSANDGTGNDLWMYSTSGGVTRINTNPNGPDNPDFFTVVGTKLFVRANDGDGNQELWMVDSSGTKIDVNTNPNGSDMPNIGDAAPYFLTPVGTKLFVNASDSNGYQELWMIDSSGTKTQIDTNPNGSDIPTNFVKPSAAVGTDFFVSAYDTNGNLELWKVDSSGTKTLININPNGSDNSSILTAAGTNLFLIASDSAGNQDLWMVDSSGTKTDINTNPNGSDNADFLTAVGSNLFVRALDGNGNQDLWMVNSSGTKTQINTNPNGSDNPSELTAVGTKLFCAAYDSAGKQDLWMVDSSGTKVDIDLKPNASDSPSFLTSTGQNLFLVAYDANTYNRELWMVDTSGTTTKINTNPAGSDIPKYLAGVGDDLFVLARVPGSMPQMFVIDEHGVATNLDVDPTSGDHTGAYYAAIGDTVYFSEWNPTHGRELWQYTGTSTSVNHEPVGTDKVVTMLEDGTYVVAASDFGFSDALDNPSNNFAGVKITQLTTAGTLKLNGVDVTLNQVISKADIDAGYLVFSPAANGNGAGYASFKFAVMDDGGTANGGVDTDQSPNAFTFNVTSVNDAPAGPNEASAHILEDTPYVVTAADFGFSDPLDNPADNFAGVKITSLSTKGTLTLNGVDVTLDQIISKADIDARHLVFTPAANAHNYASFYFAVIDDGGTANGGVNTDQSPSLFLINIENVNDAPAGTDKVVNMPENGTYVVNVADFGFSDPFDYDPTGFLTGVKITQLVTAGSLKLNGVDVTLDQVISWADINAGLLIFAPAPNAHGTNYANFAFAVIDNGGTANGGVDTDLSPNTFTFNVNGVANTAPHITIGSVGPVLEDPVGGVNLGAAVTVSDANGDPLAIDVAASAGWHDLNAAVSGAAQVTGGGTAALHITGSMVDVQNTLLNLHGNLIADFNGNAVLNVTASDGINTPVSSPVTVPVTAVNDAPMVTGTTLVKQVDPSGKVVFNAANGNLITVSDVDAGSSQLQVTLTATHGTMNLNAVTGLTFSQGDGTADATMTFTGTLVNINNALNGMSFAKAAGYAGLADVTVNVNDGGNTGTGGALSASTVASVTVKPYNTWFHGFGTEAGWDVYNVTGAEVYTKDYSTLWYHDDATSTWWFNGSGTWVGTNALGNAPYADGFGPFATWFHDTVPGSTYNGYDVFIGNGVTQFSADHTAVPATYWQVTNAGAWSYFDGSALYHTAGFNVGPTNVWFHGFGTNAGWDVYNTTGAEVLTKDYSILWYHDDATNSWYFNGTGAWVSTNALGSAPYDYGYGPWQTWFLETTGTAANWYVCIDNGVTEYYSTSYSAQLWTHSSSGWSHWNGNTWLRVSGLGQMV